MVILDPLWWLLLLAGAIAWGTVADLAGLDQWPLSLALGCCWGFVASQIVDRYRNRRNRFD